MFEIRYPTKFVIEPIFSKKVLTVKFLLSIGCYAVIRNKKYLFRAYLDKT